MEDFKIESMKRALIAAHEAGDTEGARIIAAEIRKVQTPSVMDTVGKPQPYDVTQDMSGTEKVLAGAGKAFYDVGRGVGNIVTDAFPGASKYGFATRKDTDDSRALDANLMNTGGGIAGNVLGNIAMTLPLARIPGVNTVIGGAATGAGLEALQPVGEQDSRIGNMSVGGAFGAAIPAAIRGGKFAKAAIFDPFTDSGRTKMAARMIANAADDPLALSANLAKAKGYTVGFNPTVGQAGGDAGAASLERTMRAINPAAFGTVENQQRKALADAVRGVAGTPEQIAEAIAQRRQTAGALYESALDPINQQPLTPWIKGQVTQLMKRPSIKDASKSAGRWALERGEKQTSQGSLAAMHDMKISLDDAISQAKIAGRGGEVAALTKTKNQLTTVMEKLSPDYAYARNVYADMSRPINQMEIGQNLYNRLVPAVADADIPLRLNAGSFSQALRNGDQLARGVIGRDIPLNKIMDADQLAALSGVAKDAQARLFGEVAGKGVGSDTVQKIAMSNLAAEAGIPNWLTSAAGVIPGGSMLRNAVGLLYGAADKPIQARAAQLLIDPQQAANALQRYGILGMDRPGLIRQGAQGLLLGLPPALNAAQ